MQENPDQFSQLLLEADGLLLVLLRHREDTPVDAIKLLRKKLNMILAITDDIEYDNEEGILTETRADILSEHETHEEIMESEESNEETYLETDPYCDEAYQETYNTDDESMTDEPLNEDQEVSELDEIPVAPEVPAYKADEEPDASVGDYIEETVEDAGGEVDNQPVQPAVPSMEPIVIPEASVDDEETEEEQQPVMMEEHPVMMEKEEPVMMEKEEVVFYDDSKSEPVIMDNTQVVDLKPDSVTNSFEVPRSQSSYSYTYYPEDYNDNPVRDNYDEAISNRPSAATTTEESTRRPIKTAFNLNDKFRFRRELFGNSDASYVECLDMLQAMNSIGEAREYLVEDLKWDPNNEDVKAFIELLEKYYNK